MKDLQVAVWLENSRIILRFYSLLANLAIQFVQLIINCLD